MPFKHKSSLSNKHTYCHRQHRKNGADPGRRLNDPEDPGPFGDRAGISRLQYLLHGAKARRWSGWAGKLPCGDITKGVELIDQVGSFEAASIAASIGHDLQTVADSIALAASVGVSSDLEAAAAGLGYDSFADAVAAYNAQYGTNYTEAEARENLGQ